MTESPQNNPKHPHQSHYKQQEEGKIVANPFGMLYTIFFIFDCLIFLGVWSYHLFLFNYDQDRFYQKFHEKVSRESFDTFILVSTFVASILHFLVQLYIPVRAFCQPSFIAGNPAIHKLWTFHVVATILSVYTCAVRYIFLNGHYGPGKQFLLEIFFIFSSFYTYTTDCDSILMGVAIFKPWIFASVDAEVKKTQLV